MAKPKVFDNPMYAALLLQICSGKTKPQELKKYKQLSKSHQLEYERESKKLSRRLRQLLKSPNGYSFIKKKGWQYSVDYAGIMRYICVEILMGKMVNYSPRLITHPYNIQLLKSYLLKLSEVPEHDFGLRWILQKFVIGLGKEYSTMLINRRKGHKKDLLKVEFLEKCWLYSLSVGKDGYEVIASDVLNPEKRRERERLFSR